MRSGYTQGYAPDMTKSRLALVAPLVAAIAVVSFPGSASAAAAAKPAACSGSNLTAKQTDFAAGMSQPAAYITVTNTGDSACVLNGYPTIETAWSKGKKQEITTGRGAMMNAPDNKPKRIVLQPGGKAWFALGGVEALDPPVVPLTKVAFAITPGGPTVTSRIELYSSGQPLALVFGAFAPGVGKA